MWEVGSKTRGEARRREDIRPSAGLQEHRTKLRAEDTGKHPHRYTLPCRFTYMCVWVCVTQLWGREGWETCYVAGAGHFTPVGPS